MTASNHVNLLDLLDLPDSQRELLLWLTRHGPADASLLVQSTGLDAVVAEQALAALIEKDHIQRLADGRMIAIAGKVRNRTTLPADLWQDLLTTDRLYSEQDIAVLRTAIPILQLARARLAEFSDHGAGHAMRVKAFACQLGCIVGLSEVEQDLLRFGALFHDVGNIVDRGEHNVISQETVLRLTVEQALPFTPREAEIVGLLCRWHRREYDPDRVDDLNGRIIRTGLLASVLRVADAMDIDHRRSDYTQRWSQVIRFFFPQKSPYWTSLEEILGVRIQCRPSVELQVFTRGSVQDNIQVAMLRGDLTNTPLPWTIQQVAVYEKSPDNLSRQEQRPKQQNSSALLVFPFEPHSVVMASLSRKNLRAAGYKVGLLCYPDTAQGSAWLWRQALSEIVLEHHQRLIVIIGDRPDATVTPELLKTVGSWRETGVSVSLLNRYEANWTRLPALLQRGAEVILGGDWAYFWGDPAGLQDLVWGRIAALCTRDPNQSTVDLTDEEQTITQGLLKVVYDAARQSASGVEEWKALAEPILDHIEADDRAFFCEQADDFAASYASGVRVGRVEGRVLCFETAPNQFPPSCYWALEAAIERHGRSLERGIRFKVPYAISTRRDGDMVELLAINHWREEEAIPIRFLYPGDLGPPPSGNECTLQVRLPAAQADRIVQALLDTCNQ